MASEELKVRVGADTHSFKRGMARVGSIASSAARKIKMIGIAGAAAFTTAAIVGAKFERALMETATVAQAFGSDLEAIEKTARKLGQTTAFTATQAVKGMYSLASAGLETAQIIGSVDAALQLAGATASDITQVTAILASSMKQFGVDASQSKRIVDTYAQAITSSQLTMERLAEAMKYAGTTGAALGWSIEETTAAVAQFANLGLEGSMTGTNLRMAMISLARQTDGAKEALEQMNLTFKDINPEANTFGELLKVLGDRSMTTKQAVVLFGARAGLNMKQLAKMASEGTLKFAEFTQSLIDAQKGAGRASEMYARMMDTFWGKWKIFTSALQELTLTIFDLFKNEGKEVFEFLTRMTINLTNSIRQNAIQIKIAVADVAIYMMDSINMVLRSIKFLKKVYDGTMRTVSAITARHYKISMRLAEEDLEFAKKRARTDTTEKAKEKSRIKIEALRKEFNEQKNLYLSATGWREDAYNDWKDTGKGIDIVTGQLDLFINKLGSLRKGVKIDAALGDFFSFLGGGKKDLTKKDVVGKVIADLEAEMAKFDQLSTGKDTEEIDITKQIIDQTKQLTLSELDYKRWAWAEEIKEYRENAEGKRSILDAVTAYEIATNNELIKLTIEQNKERVNSAKELLKEHQDFMKTSGLTGIELLKTQNEIEVQAVKDKYDKQIEELVKYQDKHSMILDMIAAKEREVGAVTKKGDEDVKEKRKQTAMETIKNTTDSFRAIAEAGGKYSKQAFAMYKAFAISQALIDTYKAATGAYSALASIPYVGPFLGAAAAAAAIAAGMAQVSMIKSQKPPSYDEGGVSTKPGMYYSGIPEAHIPLKSGKVPVSMAGMKNFEGSKREVNINYIQNNPTFQDLDSQYQSQVMIAEIISKRIISELGPGIIVNDYLNDGVTRTMVKGGI